MSDQTKIQCAPDDCPWAGKIEVLLCMESTLKKVHDALYYENGNRSLNGRLRDVEKSWAEHVEYHKNSHGMWDNYRLTIFSIVASSIFGAILAWSLKGHI